MIAIEQETGKKYILQKTGETEQELVRQLCESALENNGGHIVNAAKSIGINRTTLIMRMKKWKIGPYSVPEV